MSNQALRVAVDIGGTFTDVQGFDPATGAIWDFKTPTTPEDPSIGLLAGLRGVAALAGCGLHQIGMVLHGSTIATNAVLERRLPQGALLTTKGFTDVLAIGRHMRRDVYALKAEERAVLIPPQRRIAIAERTLADGTIETPLDRGAVLQAGRDLAGQGVRAIAVMFLHGFRYPAHEQEAAGILAGIPGLTVATSHETSPDIREFERVSTTVLNALLKPVISDYLERVEARLREAGITGQLLLVQSNGGVATPDEAARLPVRLLLSGPAGGAMAVAELARRQEIDNLVGLDMGGTSTDVSVVQGGRVEETASGEIDGLPVRLPMIEIRTIGAGGGSIARVESGALRVGPQSAGAVPGPASYLRGGVDATVTDANLALGIIDPESFLGGAMKLGLSEARQAINPIATGLGLTTEEAAGGIVQVADAAMAGAVRLSLFEKGADPQDFVLAAFGGAGGLHACAIAEDLNMRRVLFPATASTLSARGILGSDLRHDLLRARLMLATEAALPVLAELVADLHNEAEIMLNRDGVAPDARRVEILADMRYRGQAYEITTPWELKAGERGEANPGANPGANARTNPGANPGENLTVDPAALRALCTAFHDMHAQRYAHSSPDEVPEIVALRARVIGLMTSPGASAKTPASVDAVVGDGRVWTGTSWDAVPRHRREALPRRDLTGPLLIEEDYSVLWIGPGWSVSVLDGGDLLAVREGAA